MFRPPVIANTKKLQHNEDNICLGFPLNAIKHFYMKKKVITGKSE